MKMTIGRKLGLGFGVVVLLLTVAGGFGLYELNSTATTMRDVSEDLDAAVYAFGLRGDLDEMVWATKNILLRGTDPAVLEKELAEFADKKNRLETEWGPDVEAYLAGPRATDEEKQLYAEFQTEYADFLQAWEQALPVYKSQGQEAADTLMRGKGHGALAPLITLVRTARERALAEEEEALARTQVIVTTVIAVLVVAAVIAVVVAYSIARQLTRAAVHLSQAAESISRGDLDVAIEVKTGDEMEILAESLERMRASLKAAIGRLRKRRAAG